MRNIIDYAREEKRTFSQHGFTDVDSLVLSQLSYLNFSELESSHGEKEAQSLGSLLEGGGTENLFIQAIDEKHNKAFVEALATSPRFSSVLLTHYVNIFEVDTEKQFSAITYLLDDDSAYVAFRGTDASFIGWKEDFNMAFMSPVPSQQEAVEYLRRVAAVIDRPLRIGGHSKGGNLAVYAALNSPKKLQSRCLAVYNHDGPGFHEDIYRKLCSHPLWKDVKATVPQASVIGMLLHNNMTDFTVVESRRMGIMQHDPFSWKISDEGTFVEARKLQTDAVAFSKTVDTWLSSLDNSQRERFVDALYHVVEATGAVTFQDLSEDLLGKIGSALSAIKDVDGDTRDFVRSLIHEWFKAGVSVLKDMIVSPALPAPEKKA